MRKCIKTLAEIEKESVSSSNIARSNVDSFLHLTQLMFQTIVKRWKIQLPLGWAVDCSAVVSAVVTLQKTMDLTYQVEYFLLYSFSLMHIS